MHMYFGFWSSAERAMLCGKLLGVREDSADTSVKTSWYMKSASY